jgi:hypothetical protein
LNDNRYFAIIANFFVKAIFTKIAVLAINTISYKIDGDEEPEREER